MPLKKRCPDTSLNSALLISPGGLNRGGELKGNQSSRLSSRDAEEDGGRGEEEAAMESEIIVVSSVHMDSANRYS